MKSHRHTHLRWLMPLAFFGTLALPRGAQAQGPNREYYYSPTTTLSWAECQVYQAGGSQLIVPFLPVVFRAPKQAPIGTNKYTTDVMVDAPLVFVGDGVVTEGWDAYTNTWADNGVPVDVTDRVVMLCYDCLNARVDSGETGTSLVERLAVAATRGAAAAVLFSGKVETPFLYLRPSEWLTDELPAITVSGQTAREILSATGFRGPDVVEQLNGSDPPKFGEPTTAIRLRIDGAFEQVDTEQFAVRFKSSLIDRKDVAELVAAQNWSLELIQAILGSADDRRLPQSLAVYFAGFDSKVFYTHHWGSGLVNEAGAFMVWGGSATDTGLIAHELAHVYTGHNWGSSSSFMIEGVGRFVEARATEPDLNHRITHTFLVAGRLPPLSDLVGIDIGSHELTRLAYPASGSFVEYLATEFGMNTLRRVWDLENRAESEKIANNTWQLVFGRHLVDLDGEWRDWLRSR